MLWNDESFLFGKIYFFICVLSNELKAFQNAMSGLAAGSQPYIYFFLSDVSLALISEEGRPV